MFHHRMIVVPLSLFLLTTAGCSLIRSITGSPEERERFQTSKEELWNRVWALEEEKIAYQKQVAEQQAEIARINRDIAYWQTETARADKRFQALTKTADASNAQMNPSQAIVPATPPPPTDADKKNGAEPKALTIKVLSGDGKMDSARNLSKRLGKLGYRVKMIDKAKRSDYRVNTVFFGSGFRTAAATLAKQLGNGTVSKPLTWASAFNIIVVTGRAS